MLFGTQRAAKFSFLKFMDNKDSKVILIFVKNPIKGYVKTRLAKSIGDTKALKVYQSLLQITKGLTRELSCDRQVWYSQSVVKDDIWEDGDYSKFVQRGENLGERMKYAFRQAFETDYRKVVIIGSDCAELNRKIIGEAFKALETSEVVVGPSVDGGYYLLGMSMFLPFLFDGKSWSQDVVFEQTRNQLINRTVSHHILPVLNDIDDIEDLQRSKHISF